MIAEVIVNNGNIIGIEWSDESGFGQIIIKNNGKGGYDIDAEYLSFNKLLKILKAANL